MITRSGYTNRPKGMEYKDPGIQLTLVDKKNNIWEHDVTKATDSSGTIKYYILVYNDETNAFLNVTKSGTGRLLNFVTQKENIGNVFDAVHTDEGFKEEIMRIQKYNSIEKKIEHYLNTLGHSLYR